MPSPPQPRKSTKPLTDIVDANFKHTVQREERRKAFQADLAQKRAAKEAEVQVNHPRRTTRLIVDGVELGRAERGRVEQGSAPVVVGELSLPCA